MALTINTNIPSLIAQGSLAKATSALNTSIERMSTGYKINSAADNAAGYSIATDWSARLSSLDVASDNAAIGIDLLTTAEDSYSVLTTHYQRIRDLTEQAANGTYGSDSLKAIQAEIYARLEEIDRIAQSTEFNGIKLMRGEGTFSGVRSTGIDIQVGIDSDSNSRINLAVSLFADATVCALFNATLRDATLQGYIKAAGGTETTIGKTSDDKEAFAAACTNLKYTKNTKTLTVSYTSTAAGMLTYIDKAIANISTRVTDIGAASNRISSASTAIDVQVENLTSSLSTIRDTDIASESSEYVKQQILQQSSATLLATANQTPSIALSLI